MDKLKNIMRDENKYDFVYIVRDGDSLISLREKLMEGYHIKNGELNEGDKIIISPISSNMYVTQPLDTLNGICKKFNLSREDVVNLNELKTEKLFIGQILKFK